MAATKIVTFNAGVNGQFIVANAYTEDGVTWAAAYGYAGSDFKIDASGRVYSIVAGKTHCIASAVAATFQVMAKVTIDHLTSRPIAGVSVCVDAAADTHYRAIHIASGGNVLLYARVAGTDYLLANVNVANWAEPSTHTIEIRIVGTSQDAYITVLVDDVALTGINPLSDAHVVNGRGIGIYWDATGSGGSSATEGIHFDAWEFTDGVVAATGYTVTTPTGFELDRSTVVTLTPTPSGGVFDPAIVVTPDSTNIGDTFVPATVTLANVAKTLQVVAASAGARTISFTNDGSVQNPVDVTYTPATLPKMDIGINVPTPVYYSTLLFSPNAVGWMDRLNVVQGHWHHSPPDAFGLSTESQASLTKVWPILKTEKGSSYSLFGWTDAQTVVTLDVTTVGDHDAVQAGGVSINGHGTIPNSGLYNPYIVVGMVAYDKLVITYTSAADDNTPAGTLTSPATNSKFGGLLLRDIGTHWPSGTYDVFAKLGDNTVQLSYCADLLLVPDTVSGSWGTDAVTAGNSGINIAFPNYVPHGYTGGNKPDLKLLMCKSDGSSFKTDYLAGTAKYHPHFLELLEPFTCLRWMGAFQVCNSNVRTWSQRTTSDCLYPFVGLQTRRVLKIASVTALESYAPCNWGPCSRIVFTAAHGLTTDDNLHMGFTNGLPDRHLWDRSVVVEDATTVVINLTWTTLPTAGYCEHRVTAGICYETVIDVHNTVHKDLWLNIPPLANDAYIAALADLVRDTLDPSLLIYLEVGDELWNYASAFLASWQHFQRLGILNETSGSEEFGKRCKEVFVIFYTSFGAAARTRLRRVAPTQAANTAVTTGVLLGLKNQDNTYACDIISPAEYLAQGATDWTLDDLDSLKSNIETRIFGTIRGWMAATAAVVAGKTNEFAEPLTLVCYESGTHMIYGGGPSGDYLDDLIAMQTDARITDLYRQSFHQQRALGVKLTLPFALMAKGSALWGYWGHLEYFDDPETTPKWAALLNAVAESDTTPPTGPTVTINQASGQADPTSDSPINFTVIFSAAVTDFATGDVTLAGTAGATAAVVTGSGTTYNVAVSGMVRSGTVIASIEAGKAHDSEDNPNAASTSTDNTVTYKQQVLVIKVPGTGKHLALGKR